MKDLCRIRVLELLKETPVVPSKRIALALPEFSHAEVEGTLIELSFEGLVKIEYVPMVTITAQGKQE